MSNWLESMGKMLEEQAAKRQQENRQWEEEAGDPSFFLPSDDIGLAAKGLGTGFWKHGDEGVLAVPRFANGYNPQQATLYTNELIDTLVKVREGK